MIVQNIPYSGEDAFFVNLVLKDQSENEIDNYSLRGKLT